MSLLPFVRLASTLGCLYLPFAAGAVWICHGPNDTTWQQEHPPCVAPSPEAVMRGSRTPQNESDGVIVPRRDVQATKPPAARTPTSDARSTSVRAGTRPSQGDYAIALADLERRYPSINPDSPMFNPDVMRRVGDMADKNRGLGLDPVTALQEAVREAFHPTQIQASQSPSHPSAIGARRSSPTNVMLNEGLGGAIGALGVVGGAWFLIKVFGLLGRSSRRVAKKAVDVIDNTSAHDIARAAGGVAGVAQRKTSGLLKAFNEGKQERL